MEKELIAMCEIIILYLFFVPYLNFQKVLEINTYSFDIYDVFYERPKLIDLLLNLDNVSTNNSSDLIKSKLNINFFCSYNYNTSRVSNAFLCMDYHRKMRTKIVLSDFLSREILKKIAFKADKKKFLIDRRIGEAQNSRIKIDYNNPSANFKPEDKTFQHDPENNIRHQLVNDVGSTNNKTWLERITLDDISKQIKKKNNVLGNLLYRNKQNKNRRQTLDIDSKLTEYESNFENGDVTGYALNSSPISFLVPEASLRVINPYKRILNENGLDNKNEGFKTHTPFYRTQTVHHSVPATNNLSRREISLKDITDIALTTLAFLSFGMFILQVLMCITMNKDETSSLMMLPMETVDSSELMEDGTEEIRRKKRSIFYQITQKDLMDELSRKVIMSIDAFLFIPRDNGSCHYWSLCANGLREKKNKFWTSLWSLGMSWLSSNTFKDSAYTRILKSLTALTRGLRNASCDYFYKNTCN